MPVGQDGPGSEGRQDIHAARDAYVAGRDLTVHYYQGTGGLPEQSLEGRPVVIGDIPQQPPGFQSRSDLLAVLDATGPGVLVVQAMTGMRGVGKTQLAAAYARAKLAAGWHLVAWVNAEDPASLAGGLAAVAEAAGLTGQGGGDPGRAVRHWLEAGGDRCLLVFDNAADPDLLRPHLPVAGKARVLVTSYRQSMADLGARLGVEVFTPAEAAAFLEEQTGLADTAGAAVLAEELGFLPLALAQAAGMIAGQRLPYITYLERLRALPVGEYLTRKAGQPYPQGVAEAVLLSLETVRASDPFGACSGVMEVLSVLSAAGVRRDLLHAAGQAGILASSRDPLDAAGVDEVLGRLAEWSLLAFTLDGQAVLAHRLVLRVVRESRVHQRNLTGVCRAVAGVLEARASALAGSLDRVAVREIPEQVTALWQAAAGLPDSAGDLETVLPELRRWALYHLNALGDSAAQAIAVGEPLLEDAERLLGADHRTTLASQYALANAYRDAGRTAEAIPLHERTLAARDRLLGPDAPSTLASRASLALAYGEAGRTTEAILLHEQTLAAKERLDPDDPSTLVVRNNLANAYRETGRTDKAIPLFEQTHAAIERLDPDDPSYLASRNNLALAYMNAGRTDEAIPLFEQAMAACERLLGLDHPSTLTSWDNLAIAYKEAGRTDEAIPLFEQAMAARERLLGPDHPSTLTSWNNLANGYKEAGRTDEAIPLHEQALAACERVLGSDHPDTLTSRANLAATYRKAGRTDEAIPLEEQLLADGRWQFPPNHPLHANAPTSWVDFLSALSTPPKRPTKSERPKRPKRPKQYGRLKQHKRRK